jgi:tRNA(Arg) A34 adenosine deaminase TadA
MSSSSAIKPNPALLRRTIELAGKRMHGGHGGPFGALVAKDDEVIAEGWNRVTSTNDPTAHAEIVALRRAAEKLGLFHLTGCVLYASCEPCPMCLAAAYWARVDAVFFAATRHDAAKAGFVDEYLYDEVCKPVEVRELRMQQVTDLQPEAWRYFQEWLAKEDKVAY